MSLSTVGPLVISTASLLIALTAFARTVLVERRKLLIELHGRFISPESSANRAALHRAFETHGPEWYLHVDRDAQVRINSGMAQLDAMAFQVRRRYVSRRDAKALWGDAMAVCLFKSEAYMTHRRATNTTNLWVYLEAHVRTLDSETKRIATRAFQT